MIKKIYVVKKETSILGKILSVKFEEDNKTYTRKIDDNLAIEIIEVLCKALKKPFPENYKFEK